jgi:hypothetical protein
MTKGQLEAKISEAVSKFEIEYMGRGPKLSELTSSATCSGKAFRFFKPFRAKAHRNPQGIELFKKMRSSLFEGVGDILKR